MTTTEDQDIPQFDPEQLRAKYRSERDKRLRADGNEQYIDILELIWLSRSEHLRLFRRGQQAPLREIGRAHV